MNTQLRYLKALISLKPLVALLAIITLSGCLAKKCPIPQERQKSITLAWRLVATDDPDFNGLNKYTFPIFTFNQDFTGDVKVVQNNTQYENPVRLLNYDIDSEQKLLRIQFSFPNGSGSSSSTNSGNERNNDIREYSYQLGRTLELVRDDGTFYKLVPFTGILSPDDICEF